MKTDEKRKTARYDTQIKIYFDIEYDVDTKVNFELTDDEKETHQRYSGRGRNVSTEGIGFVSDVHLAKNQKLDLEVIVPSSQEPIKMTGVVRWSMQSKEQTDQFETGVKVLTVNDKAVYDSIHFDDQYHVEWSVLLNTVLDEYKKIGLKRSRVV